MLNFCYPAIQITWSVSEGTAPSVISSQAAYFVKTHQNAKLKFLSIFNTQKINTQFRIRGFEPENYGSKFYSKDARNNY